MDLTKEIYFLTLIFCFISVAHLNGVKPVLAPLAEHALLGEFPHQVSLQMWEMHFCGGSLITLQHILTAAHCIDKHIKLSLEPSNYKIALHDSLIVKAGSVDLMGGQWRKVKRLSVDRRYVPVEKKALLNDVAVITVDEPFEESQYVKPIRLPRPGSEIYQGTPVVVTGFGQASKENKALSFFLQKSNMVIVPKSECDSYFNLDNTRRNSNFCAKMTAGYGICEGDSGGPLIADNTLIGVVSCRMDPDCGMGLPDLYARVSDFLPYINSEIDPKSEKIEGIHGLARAVNIEEPQRQRSPQLSRNSRRVLQDAGGWANPQQPQFLVPQQPYPQQLYPQRQYHQDVSPQLQQPQLPPDYGLPQSLFPVEQPQTFHPQTQFLGPQEQYHAGIPLQETVYFEPLPPVQQHPPGQLYYPQYQNSFPIGYSKKK